MLRTEPPRDATANDDARWLALLLRQGLLVIVRGIERRYGLRPSDIARHEGRAIDTRARGAVE